MCKGCNFFFYCFLLIWKQFNFSLLKNTQRCLIILTTKKRSPNLWIKSSWLDVCGKLLFPNRARRQSYLIFSVDKQTQPIFRNGFRFPQTGFLSCFSYSLTSDTKSKLRMAFAMHMQDSKEPTGFLCNSKPTH